jgi:hypothetical protein
MNTKTMSGRVSKKTSLVIEQLDVMLSQEKTVAYKRYDYLNSKESAVSAEDRQDLCNWGYSIIATLAGIDKSAVAVAISYFDRYLSSSKQSVKQVIGDRGQVQLAFVSCLVIALKAHSGMSVEMNFVSDVLCGGTYEASDITEMEFEIMRSLKWRLNVPTPHDFIDAFLQVLPSTEPNELEILSCYANHVASVGITSYFVALHSPSSIAYASICCALELMDTDMVPSINGLHNMISQCITTTTDAIDGSQFQTLLRALISMMKDHLQADDQGMQADELTVSSEDSPTSCNASISKIHTQSTRVHFSVLR